MTDPARVEHVTCLGCGCGCDDITVTVSNGRISGMTPACPGGKDWLGDGTVPWEIQVAGRPASLEQATRQATETLLAAQGRVLVYLGPDITSQAQRAAVALADLLCAAVDSATSATAAEGLLAAQRRGRAGATLGELKNRADVVLFWGVDPAQRYPRFMERYVEPAGTHVPEGRKGRTLIGVTVGQDTGTASVDLSLTLDPNEEITALSLMRASLLGYPSQQTSPGLVQAMGAADRLSKAKYAVLVHDADPTTGLPHPLRAEGLIALTQALNGPTRAALISLRSGGNRVGAESVLSWQAGYPFSVDYTAGHPRYEPGRRGMGRLQAGGFAAVLFVGTPLLDQKSEVPDQTGTIVIGPRASQAPFPTAVAIDTGIGGIHEGGTAYRSDEVPLRLRPPLQAERSTVEVLQALSSAVRDGLGRSRA